MSKVHLPVLPRSSLRGDGTRNAVHPADVSGRFDFARRIVFIALIGIWAVLPWVTIGGNPAVFLDIESKRFFLFGLTYNSQDLWLLFFLVAGTGLLLVYVTAVLGRVFCGWVCPHTVFFDGVYRKIERWIEGPREQRIRRNAAPWTVGKVAIKVLKHTSFLLVSVFIAHVFLSYFASLPRVFEMVRAAPGDHPEAFVWVVALTGVFYGHFAFFREQLCLVVCPYGRLQSVLIDADSLVVGYDERRGEPRGKATEEGKGDCVDCSRCVVVCPTGIDIRNGLQLDCTGCTACIDACDDVMVRLERPRGLIRYDSLNGLQGKPRRLIRPRVLLYTALLIVGAGVAFVAFRGRADFEANLLRLGGAPYVVEAGTIRNAYEIHLVNKLSRQQEFEIVADPIPNVSFVVPLARLTLEPLTSVHAPLFVAMPRSAFQKDYPVRIQVRNAKDPAASKTVQTMFLGPTQR
jgi:cytochrome c oxidase accessory protein FixG